MRSGYPQAGCDTILTDIDWNVIAFDEPLILDKVEDDPFADGYRA
jgi:hypothetical protein